MSRNIFFLIILLTIVCQNPLIAQTQKIANSPTPKLVVVLSVDQMRTDYLTRYWNKFQEGGFKRLVNEGAVCSNAQLDLHIQKLSTGTATLFTGVYPATHGIVSDSWYDRLKKKEINCTSDDYFITVGSDSKEGERSANKLLSPTLGDLIRMNYRNKSKVFSVAMNDASAVLSAGHAANGAYWFDAQTGNMISSSYYVDIFPDWVRQFNEKGYAKTYTQREWSTLLPISSYEESLADDYVLEKGYYDKWNTFPYSMKKLKEKAISYKFLKTTPFANNIIRDFATSLILAEKLGKDEYPDLLTLTFSSMDYENSSFGPASVEMEDTYLRLDQDIALLLDFFDKTVGKGNSVVVLTSTCSSTYPVDYLKEEFRMPVGTFSPESAIALLKSFLNITYGQGEWIEFVGDHQIYFNHDLLEKKNVSLQDIQTKTANFINQFEGVKIALPSASFEQGDYTKGQLAVIANSYNFKRSGDVLYQLENGWQPVYKYDKINYNDNSNIPFIFYGDKIRHKQIRKKVLGEDMVPTLLEILHMSIPDNCVGSAIDEIVE
ncbi:MAG TPA: alkaline phosphatase family protein [Prolixibacteraceae bacterium]|nr:alkaline phosphatase family protein [Prolixibacteraceae bacterium]HPR85528.1 alkaline phosphatase family protein [Prolixibacteraceae bacterium]